MDVINTPRKIYCVTNICLLCGMSFILTEKSSEGEIVEKKLFKLKLRLTVDRVATIRQVIPDFEISADEKNGVCNRCFRRIENVIKTDVELAKQKEQLRSARANVAQTFLTLPSPKKFTVKRQLKSPSVEQPAKHYRGFPTQVVVRSPVRLSSLQNVFIQPKKITPTEPVEFPAQKSSSVLTKPVKRSLGFSDKENMPSLIPQDGSVEVTVYHASGKKCALINSERHKSLCKVIARGSNVEKVLVGKLIDICPMEVVNGTSKILKEECRKLCKKGSETILQKKDYESFFSLTWENFYSELANNCPGLLSVVSAIISDKPLYPSLQNKPFYHLMLTSAVGLHGRNQDMSAIQYMIGFILTHGGCTQRTVERLSKIGLSVHPQTIARKLAQWQNMLDSEIIRLKESWANGSSLKYQLVGDNWDKNILPSYRTSDRKTVSLHLFNMYAIVDRVIPQPVSGYTRTLDVSDLDPRIFIPSIDDQEKLMKELIFIFATAVISNNEQMNKFFGDIYPRHLEHPKSQYAGEKTVQYPLGLFDCNENKTKEMIRLLKHLSATYVPQMDGEMVESVFLGGDRLTDERVQSAQKAMLNGATPMERLEGFISKIEDFHRLMNFLENDEQKDGCRALLLDADRVAVLNQVHSNILAIWSDADCSDCFSNITEDKNGTVTHTLSEPTKHFLDLYANVTDCINWHENITEPVDKKHNETVCTICVQSYTDINSHFKKLMMNTSHHVCMDLVDMMNYTRLMWGKTLHCSRHYPDDLPVILIASFLACLPIAFYCCSWYFGGNKQKKIIQQKRMPKRLQSIYGTYDDTEVDGLVASGTSRSSNRSQR